MSHRSAVHSERRIRRKQWAFSWWCSIAIHAVGLSALVMYLLQRPVVEFKFERITIEGGIANRVDEANAELRPQEEGTSEKDRWLRDIKAQIAKAEARGDTENLERLQKLTQELNRSSSTKSVEEMSEYFGGLFGRRASAPVERASELEFDVSTAQIHEVSRQEDGAGGYAYLLVMVDAKGVAREVPIDAQTGERLYKTMKMIKSNPLLERVYRNILMGILDQVLGQEASP
jgi:hypothetical protein